MKKNLILAAVFTLAAVFSVSAQKATDFSGTWTLDTAKSKLGDRNMIESQTLTVTQNDKEIKIETASKMKPPPEGGPQRGARMGMMGGGDGISTYSLDGKETKSEVQGPMGAMPVSMKAAWDGSKLKLTRSSSFSGPMGDVTIGSKETWSLGTDGVLTVERETSSPRGTNSTTLVFSKK